MDRSQGETSSRLFGALVATLALAGCDSCKHDRPFTPYTLGDSPSATTGVATSPSGATSAGARDGGAPSFAPIPGTNAAGDGRSWTVGGATIAAPAGRAFGPGLEVDLDGDGKPDLLAWAKTPDGLRGELVFASSAHPDPQVVVALPADLTGAACSAHAAFTLVGPGAAMFDFEPKCAAKGKEHPPRWVALLRAWDKGPALGFELRVAPLPDGETLKIGFDTSDRDRDGRPDVAAMLTLSLAARGKASAGAVTATLAFLDRPAGLSRDATEPEASFKQASAATVADAHKRTTAKSVSGNAMAIRALDAALCDDGGRALITTPAGPVRCGERRALTDTRVAEVEAALNLSDALAAVAAMGRLDATGEKRKDVEKLFDKNIPKVDASPTVKAIQATPKPLGFGVGPLAFLPSGDLLVQTASGVVEVDKRSFAESPSAASTFAETLGWPVDAPKWSLQTVEVNCNDQSVSGRFLVDGAAVLVPFPVAGTIAPSTPCPSAAPAGINARRADVSALGDTTRSSLLALGSDVIALSWASPPTAELATTLATPPGLTVPFGVARSPDRSRIALIFSRGVLVAKVDANGGTTDGKLWRSDRLKAASFCVPPNEDGRLACVVDSAAVLFEGK